MSIVKPPQKTPAEFLNGAPDGKPKEPPTSDDQTTKEVRISLTMPPALLKQIDAAASRQNISRAAFIKSTMSDKLNK